MPEVIIFRERVPRQAVPLQYYKGAFISERAYGLADGSVHEVSNDDFDEFEKQHSLPSNH
jgi:hypothetical protein